jgi:hypothetical protein
LPGAPALTIAKTASASTFVVGVAASYALRIENTGTTATTAVATVTDTIPTGLTIGTPPAGCAINPVGSQTIVCTIASGLATGAANAVTFTIPVTPTAAAGTSVSNTATVSGGGDPSCPAAARCASTVITPLNAPDMTVTITGLPLTAAPGATLNGTLTCTNTAASAQALGADCAAVAGTPAGATVVRGQCLVGVTPVTPPVATLAANASIVCPLTVTMPANQTDSTTTQSSVGIDGSTSASNETNTSNNTDNETVAIIDAINDTASVGSVAGGVVTILTNDELGATANPTVGVNGIKPPTIVVGPNTTLPGASINASNQIVVPPGTLPGPYTVEYEICTDPDTTPLACDRAVASITVTNTQVDVVSAVDVPAIVGPGQVVSGEIVCTNNGAIAATDMTCEATTSTSGATVVVGTCTTVPPSTLTSVVPGGALTCPLTITAPGARGGVDETATQVVVDGNTSALNETATSTGNNTSAGNLAIIDAVNDSGSASSISGGTIAILDNDRLGTSVTAPTIAVGGILTPTIISGANTTLTTATINPTTGVLNVPPGTPAGPYTVEYEICAQAVSTACDRAIVSITVDDTSADMVSTITLPPSIAPGQTVTGTIVCRNTGPATAEDAVCDASTAVPGASVTVGVCTASSGTAALLPRNATLTCSLSVTAPANTGALSEVTPTSILVSGTTGADNETPPQLANNGSSATLIVIDALNDSGTVGSVAGGTLNVLTNDQNGTTSPPTLGVGGTNTIVQTGGTAPPGGTVLTLNPATGVITVPPGSVPGVYTVVYNLCSVPATTPVTCDTATATITVDDTSFDMTSSIVGLPASIGPGTTVTGSVVCTNAGPATAANPTCTVATTTPGASVTITGACVASVGSSLTSLIDDGTLTCPISVTAPANPAAPGNVGPTDIVITSTTSADAEQNTANNGDSEQIAIVDAVNDSANVGATGGSVNVLTNDAIGTTGATVGMGGNSTVAQQPGATAPAGGTPLTLDPTTGLITVPADSIPGVYTVPYQLCSTNPVNACDTAVATITVAAGVADMGVTFPVSGSSALPITVAPGQSYTGLQLTCTNAGPNLAISPTCAVSVSVGTVSGLVCVPAPASTPVLGVGASITCTFNYTAPGTLGGTDTPPQTVVFTGITGANNDSDPTNNIVQGVAPGGQVTIVIDAIDDSATVESSTGGTVPLLPNDQLGTTTNPSVSATGVTAPVVVPGVNTTLPGASINGSNEVVVAPGTPPGVYTVEYRICAQAVPTVCDNAIVTITIPGVANVDPSVVPTLDPKLLLVLIALMAAVGLRGQRRSKQ